MRWPTPDTLRTRIATRYRRQRGDWLTSAGSTGAGDWPLPFNLGEANETQARQHWDAFNHWRLQWQAYAGSGRVQWQERRWHGLGIQQLPQALVFDSAQEIAQWLGDGTRWRQAQARYARLIQRWPVLQPRLPAQFDLLADLEELDFLRLCTTFEWLLAHPDSQLFARQLPIENVHSKWLDNRRAILADWLRCARGAVDGADFFAIAGLRREPVGLRLHILDRDLRARVGGLRDLQVPLNELRALQLPARHVFIVENLRTGLAFDDLPGSVVLMALGYSADLWTTLPWVQAADRCWYWGDLDTHGLAILNRVRAHLPVAQSLLMDEATLLAHRSLCGEEDRPHPAESLDRLTAQEQHVYNALRQDHWGVRLRLEQERIGWPFAWKRIVEAAGGVEFR